NNTNTYSGDSNVTAGTLALGATGSLSNTNVYVNSGGTLQVAAGSNTASVASLNLNGGTLKASAAATLSNNPVVTANSTIDTGANAVTFSGSLSGASGLAITKLGTGTLTLNASASGYVGGWQINAGTVAVTAAGTSA